MQHEDKQSGLDAVYRAFYHTQRSAAAGAHGEQPDEVDYNELSALAEGTATELSRLRAHARALVDPAFAGVWARVCAECGTAAPAHVRLRLAARLPRALAVAASVVLVASGALMLGRLAGLVRHGAHEEQLVFRGDPRGAYAHGSGVYAQVDGSRARQKVYDRALALLVDVPCDTPGTHATTQEIAQLARVLLQCQFADVVWLSGPEATRAAIIDTFKRMLWEAGTNGAVMLYFNGLGLVDSAGMDTLLVPYDGVPTKGSARARNISLTLLDDLARLFRVPAVALIVDGCAQVRLPDGMLANVAAVATYARPGATLAGRLADRLQALQPGMVCTLSDVVSEDAMKSMSACDLVFAKE